MIGLYTSPLFTSILPARVGYIIQQKRKQLGLTQKELSVKTRFSKYMISKIERGMHDIKITEIGNILATISAILCYLMESHAKDELVKYHL